MQSVPLSHKPRQQNSDAYKNLVCSPGPSFLIQESPIAIEAILWPCDRGYADVDYQISKTHSDVETDVALYISKTYRV
jgi:hypothetical protein